MVDKSLVRTINRADSFSTEYGPFNVSYSDGLLTVSDDVSEVRWFGGAEENIEKVMRSLDFVSDPPETVNGWTRQSELTYEPTEYGNLRVYIEESDEGYKIVNSALYELQSEQESKLLAEHRLFVMLLSENGEDLAYTHEKRTALQTEFKKIPGISSEEVRDLIMTEEARDYQDALESLVLRNSSKPEMAEQFLQDRSKDPHPFKKHEPLMDNFSERLVLEDL